MGFKNPEILFQEAKNEIGGISGAALFNDSKYQKLREKLHAAIFGLGYQEFIMPCEIRMEAEQDNSVDFYLLVDKKQYPFQETIKMAKGREKIGREFKERERNPRLFTPYRPAEGSVKCAEWIYEAVQKKTKYPDAHKLNLLVYAKFEANDYNRDEIVNVLNPFKDKFASIWVITNHAIASIFTNNDLGEINDFKIINEFWPPAFARE